MSKAVRIIGFVLSLICLAVIVYLSLAKDVNVPQYIVGKDKGAHFLAYMALGFLFFVDFHNSVRHRIFLSNLMPVLGAFFLSFLCGYTIELCQPRFGRFFEAADLIADGLGALTGALIGLLCVYFVCLIERRRKKKG
ncbi:MAG: VanZ family protein [Spirochaetales bacterium]|nr:VanZ family protein [Spirochaetales bacterium]